MTVGRYVIFDNKLVDNLMNNTTTRELEGATIWSNLIVSLGTLAFPFVMAWVCRLLTYVYAAPGLSQDKNWCLALYWGFCLGWLLLMKPLATLQSIPVGSVGLWYIFGWVVHIRPFRNGPVLCLGSVLYFPAQMAIQESRIRGSSEDTGINIEIAAPNNSGDGGKKGLVSATAKFAVRYTITQLLKLIPQLGLKPSETINWQEVHKEKTIDLIKSLILDVIRGKMPTVIVDDVLSRNFTFPIDELRQQARRFGIEIESIVLTRVDLSPEYLASLVDVAQEAPERDAETRDLQATLANINAALTGGGAPGSPGMDPQTALLVALASKKGMDPKTLMAIAITIAASKIGSAFGPRNP